MKANKLPTTDQLLIKELVVFVFKQKNGKNPIAFKNIFIKNEFKIILVSNQTLFQKDVLAQFVSNLFHTVVQFIGMAFLLT